MRCWRISVASIPAHAGDDLALLTAAFGPPGFVYLRREDLVGQAVSRLRAEQTDVWFETTASEPTPPAAVPRFDAVAIGAYVREAEEHDAAWLAWFGSVGLMPLEVTYEDLAAEPSATACLVLGHLGLSLPLGTVLVPEYRRMADALSVDWARRYRATTRPG